MVDEGESEEEDESAAQQKKATQRLSGTRRPKQLGDEGEGRGGGGGEKGLLHNK